MSEGPSELEGPLSPNADLCSQAGLSLLHPPHPPQKVLVPTSSCCCLQRPEAEVRVGDPRP